MADKTDIFIFAHWQGMPDPQYIGILTAQQAKGKKVFSFEYNREWINTHAQLILDPDIAWFSGPQYPIRKDNFGVFFDSMPDSWGRTLMKRRAAQKASELKIKTPTLYDIDFLLGVFDQSRMGGLRFKLHQEGPFLDNNSESSTPPWASIRELQHAASMIESAQNTKEESEWLALLVAPGSSLGGARPKANILDDQYHPWIAKFPSAADSTDKALWEFLAYQMAIEAGIEMAESRIERIAGKHHTFFTKRFDRVDGERVHFSSAMTMTGNNEDTIRDNPASYLDIAEFIQLSGSNITADLAQLWRRIIFNIMISNTDDHLRNHGFIINNKGWQLSPAYDVNPSIEKNGLALNIDMDNNALDLELAISVGRYFQLNEAQMKTAIKEVLNAVGKWKQIAKDIGIPRIEQQLMAAAFM